MDSLSAGDRLGDVRRLRELAEKPLHDVQVAEGDYVVLAAEPRQRRVRILGISVAELIDQDRRAPEVAVRTRGPHISHGGSA